jgi:release factor glutamine methyltransferase
MQLRPTLDSAIAQLTAAGTGSPRLNAEVLLMFTLGCDRAYLYAHAERELSADESARYQAALGERARGKPAQYITGHQEFWGLDFLVSPAVLIPRPETEHVIETVLELVDALPVCHPEARSAEGPALRSSLDARHSPLRLVDVGTGSGCIALALAKELPGAEIVAVDISAAALEIARANAARLQLEQRVRFLESNLLAAFLPSPSDCHPERSESRGAGRAQSKDPYPADRLPADPKHSHDVAQGSHFDFIVSNPPYVGSSAPEKVQREVREYEPRVAVFAGESGLEVYRQLIPQARERLEPGGWLVMEIGFSMEAAVRALLTGWQEVRVTHDLQGIPRVVAARFTTD